MFPRFRHVAGCLLATLHVALAQFSFPDCVSQCVDQSTDDSCSLTDAKCICRQSNGRFLPDLVICMKSECNDSLSVDALLNPMAVVCRLIGTPISESALDNARNIDSASPVTTTVFVPSPSFTTVTTSEDSKTVVLVYPITVRPDDNEEGRSTVTRFPPGTTLTQTRSSGPAATSLVPVIIVSVDDEGNTQTTTSTQTITQSESAQETDGSSTDDDADTTSTATSGASTTTAETTATTTVAPSENQSAETTTTATSGATTSTATQSADRLGGPFSQQPEGAASRGSPALGLGLTIALFVAGLFY